MLRCYSPTILPTPDFRQSLEALAAISLNISSCDDHDDQGHFMSPTFAVAELGVAGGRVQSN